MIELRLRVEVGAGLIEGTHVGMQGSMFGSSKGRWAYVLSGDEVDRTLAADRLNTAGMFVELFYYNTNDIVGNVVVTLSAWNLVGAHCEGERLEDTDVYWVCSKKKKVPSLISVKILKTIHR